MIYLWPSGEGISHQKKSSDVVPGGVLLTATAVEEIVAFWNAEMNVR
jgi:hypothetical protein